VLLDVATRNLAEHAHHADFRSKKAGGADVNANTDNFLAGAVGRR
jgi:hypothetical protein